MKTRLLKRLRKEANEMYEVMDCSIGNGENGLYLRWLRFYGAPFDIESPRLYGNEVVLTRNTTLTAYPGPEFLGGEWWVRQIIEKKRRYILSAVEKMRQSNRVYSYTEAREEMVDRLNYHARI